MRRTAIVIAAVAIAAVATAGYLVLDNHRWLTVEQVVNAEYNGADVTTNPVEVECDEPDCVEAYSTVEADYSRFGSRERAAEYAATLDDGFVVHYIVMDFDGKDASREHQRWAMELLAGTWQDYHGEFPER
jgi:osmotically inducible lipoprotein OsmE